MSNIWNRRAIRTAVGSGISALGLCLGILGAAAPAGAAGGGCENANTSSASLSNSEATKAIACLFNQARSGPNVSPDGDLTEAARKHTQKMRKKECFSHQCPGEPALVERVKRTGYSNSPFVGEAIQINRDNATPDDIVDEWLNSGAHRALIKDSRFNDVGVGLDVNNNSALYTAVLGRK